MTDRELLELAARADGIKGEWVVGYGSGDYYYQGNNDGIYYEHDGGGFSVWNPLTDDGDALRLAVKLDIEPKFLVDTVQAVVVADPDGDAWETCLAEEKIGLDKLAATRRAIVRAAAAIARQEVGND